MNNINIVATRVDERLIHGQIGLSWANEFDANIIIVINNQMALDRSRQALAKMIIPSRMGLRFLSIEDAIKILPMASESQKLFLIFKNLDDLIEFTKSGIEIKKFNLGNQLKLNPVVKLGDNLSLNKDDVEMLYFLLSQGVKIDLRSFPGDTTRYLKKKDLEIM